MKKVLTALAMATSMVGANAGIFLFDNEFSASGYDCANTTFGCAALRTTAIAGGVHFEFLGLLQGTEKITALYGNVSPFIATTALNIIGTGADAFAGFSSGQDSFKADGDGFFDWRMDFNPSSPTFSGNDLIEFDLMGMTLAEIDSGISVNGPVGKNGFHFAIHTQGIGATGGSGWFSGDPAGGRPTPFDEPGTVSEPTTLMLAGMALFGLWAGGKRKES